MHPYIYEIMQQARELELERYHQNERWLHDLPPRASWYKTLYRALTLRLMALLRFFAHKIRETGWQSRPEPRKIKCEQTMPSTRAS